MSSSVLLDKFIKALQLMPGIGPVSASRIAYTLLERKRDLGIEMAEVIKQALEQISRCPSCQNYSDEEGKECDICSSLSRKESAILCVVETPSDVQAIEESGSFQGTYFVLHGHLSPLDGIGVQELGLDILFKKLTAQKYKEVILALSQTVEGNATATFISNFCKRHEIEVSQIASGVPIGGELNAVDGSTLATSIAHRRKIQFILRKF